MNKTSSPRRRGPRASFFFNALDSRLRGNDDLFRGNDDIA